MMMGLQDGLVLYKNEIKCYLIVINVFEINFKRGRSNTIYRITRHMWEFIRSVREGPESNPVDMFRMRGIGQRKANHKWYNTKCWVNQQGVTCFRGWHGTTGQSDVILNSGWLWNRWAEWMARGGQSYLECMYVYGCFVIFKIK